MTRAPAIPETVTIHVPFRIVKRGGRKVIDLPEGAARERPRVDNTMIKALARAFRWKRMLESGQFLTIEELAVKEAIAATYVTRLLRLTLLAPALVESILSASQSPDLSLSGYLRPFPSAWSLQSVQFARPSLE